MFEPSFEPKPGRLQLPVAPESLRGPVKAWRQPMELLTYEPAPPDKNPMFLEKRVYQGSSGRVYPLPFFDRIAIVPVLRAWDAIHIENEFLRLMILPEIGGRIHIGYDKVSGYDFFYRQDVIKPALVGLAGPWISGGVEFNWPQHHRPATFMPVETEIEQHPDGSMTVWCSDHDPMLRMKGMHGVCLRPGRAVVELKVRLFNRTPYTQTFLWWANVATRVHEHYQSFFPPDVRFVADHAKRAVTSFPLSDRPYYGIDYAGRARKGVPQEEMPGHFVPDGSYPENDLSWYANIPVPTSYMITDSAQDFFGGYDHAAGAGVVHVASHHIAPGKKQWTWGNHEFGYAWDRSLTDDNGPYIELMAGVYTDNQPDFSFLAPWETKTFTQSWFPIHGIGVPQAANNDAALHVEVRGPEMRGPEMRGPEMRGPEVRGLDAVIGLQVTENAEPLPVGLARVGAGEVLDEVLVEVWLGGSKIEHRVQRVTVAEPLLLRLELPAGADAGSIAVRVMRKNRLLIEYEPAKIRPCQSPAVAREPAAPDKIESVEELYLTGLHLEQYHHATRAPEPYWEEALRRDAGNSRVHTALGQRQLRRGRLDAAAEHFCLAHARLAAWNANPRDGEALYCLGITERLRGNESAAYDALYKATWNAAWRGPAYFALAEIDASRGDWAIAIDHLERSLRAEADNLNARNLRVRALEALGRPGEAAAEQEAIRRLDPLDVGSRWREGILPSSGQEALDLAFDLLRCGQREEAAAVLRGAGTGTRPYEGTAPMILFTLARVQAATGNQAAAEQTRREAEAAEVAWCFPSRLEEMLVLEATLRESPESPSAAYLLGNLLYNHRRHGEAIALWESAARLRPGFSTVWRNLGIARFNVGGDQEGALRAFDSALAANPADGRVVYERDQLWKRIGVPPAARLNELERFPLLIEERDDLSVELATLLNQVGRPREALRLLEQRRFQPWEGGEGLVLGQYVRSRVLLGRAALAAGEAQEALGHFLAAKHPPENLGEAKHLLANQSDIDYWLGCACQAQGDAEGAAGAWSRAARQLGDFEQMSVRGISKMTYWTGMAQLRLGEQSAAQATFERMLAHAGELERMPAKIDFFATSLPALLLFEEDLEQRVFLEARLLRAQALVGLGRRKEALAQLEEVLRLDGNDPAAADLLRQMEDETVGAR